MFPRKMTISTINQIPTRMLEADFTKGERSFHKIEDKTINGQVWHMYACTMNKGLYNENTSIELFRQRFGKKSTFDHHADYSMIERYPCSEDFGQWAFSFLSTEQAERYIAKHIAK